ncbi:MAG: hypothetical protein QGG25_15350, partial [Phycisphaerae bacterium]|nr:hypothetical protein [Phycisphaerae bacterium]
LFTNKDLLKRQVIELACNEGLRMEYGERLKHYLEEVVSWDVVAQQYNEAYDLARQAKQSGKPVALPKEW